MGFLNICFTYCLARCWSFGLCFSLQRCALFDVKALVLSITLIRCMCSLVGFHVPFVTGGHLAYCVIALMNSHISWRFNTHTRNLRFLIRVHEHFSLLPLSGRRALLIESWAIRLLRIYSLVSLYSIWNRALLPACFEVGMTSACGSILFFSFGAEAFICV